MKRLVYLIAIEFGGVAIICAAGTKDIDQLLTNEVGAKLHSPELQRHRRNNVDTSHVDVETPIHEVEKE
jgi:hypothetical protein